MKKACYLLLFLMAGQNTNAQDMHARLDSLMNYFATEYNFNGVVFVASKGDVIFDQAYGYRNIQKKVLHDTSSIFQVGTITSQLTAEVIFQLEREHKLTLDDKISKYFPRFPKGDSITIRNLLTNTSGIVDYFLFDGYFDKHDTLHVREDSVAALFNTKPPQGIPGARFRYSSSNYLLLGYIIEQVTHKNYAKVFRERIFTPLGMTHSGFDFRGLKSKYKSIGYRNFSTDALPLHWIDSTLTGAAAGLYTTPQDLYKWHKALQSYKLLDKATQDYMATASASGYAYGTFVDTVYGKIALKLGGPIQGFANYFIRIPADDLCIIIMQNISFPAFDNNTLWLKIADALYQEDFVMPTPIPAVTLSPAQLALFNGEYIFPSAVSLVITTNGNNLHGHNVAAKGFTNKGPDFELIPIGQNKFKTTALNAIVEFVTDGHSNATKLIMHQTKHDITAVRKTGK